MQENTFIRQTGPRTLLWAEGTAQRLKNGNWKTIKIVYDARITVFCMKKLSKKNLPARRRKWQPTPEFLPGKSHGQMSLVDYSLWHHRVGHNLATEQQQHTVRQTVIWENSS